MNFVVCIMCFLFSGVWNGILSVKLLIDRLFNWAVLMQEGLYNLYLLAENIEDDKSNKTLFGLFKLK